MKEIDKILNSLDEFAGYLVDENVGARYIDALSDLEAAIYKHESDSDCEHEFESCPAVKCEKCGLILED